MRTFYKILFLLSIFASLNALEEAEEITVYLPTSNSFTPVYLSDVQSSSSTFDSLYCNQLKDIFSYDFRYDGMSAILMKTEEKEKLLREENKQIAFNPLTWKSFGAKHVILVKIQEQFLHISLLSVPNQTLKHLPPFKLSGSLASDRRVVHRVTDILHKLMYDTPGVAHSRFLYCLQAPRGKEKKWVSEIWECDWDGANARQVTHEQSYCVTPAFLPSSGNQDRFIYVSYKRGQPKIYVSSLTQGEGKPLISLKGNQLLPAISPQKDKIAFICDASGRTDLFVQRLNPHSGKGSTPVQLFSYPRSTQASPTFSPDGSKVAFVSDKDGGQRIYLIPSETAKRRATPQLLTRKNSENSCPSWSPDGTKIAYSAKTKGARQIWIYDFATGEERQLTDGPGNKENPAWAPDSLHLVFNSTGSEQSELYVVNLNQPEAIKITHGVGKKDYPAWGMRDCR